MVWENGRVRHLAHGTLRVSDPKLDAEPFEDRLHRIYEALSARILELRPDVLVVEKVFFAKNALSALKLGQARGAAILTGRIHGLPLVEYAPSEVKQALAGHGHAPKEQLAKVLRMILGSGIGDFETADASDGLALAVCHALALKGPRASSLPSSAAGRTSKKRLSLAESLGLNRGER